MTTLIESSLADYLRLVRPHISPQLISLENWSNINVVARVLPSAITSFFGFECRLGVKEAHGDFLISADAAQAGRKVLASDNYSITLPDFLMDEPVWRHIRDFGTHWDTELSVLYKKVRNVWLEFDINGQTAARSIPSCFFGPEPIYSAKSIYSASSDDLYPYQWVTQTALKLLLDKTLPSQVEHQLFNCFDLLPTGAHVFQIGLMLARKSELVRICIRDISPAQILEYLTQINWSGSVSELKVILTKLSSLVERIDLDIDVGEVISPKIGLECYLTKQPKFEPRWQLFLSYLVETGLCTPEKRDALLAYSGYIRETSERELWPSRLRELSKFLGPEYERVFFRRLHHIKVVYQPEMPLEAKAYLSASHDLMSLEFASQWRGFQTTSVQFDNFLTPEEKNRLLDYVLQHESDFVASTIEDPNPELAIHRQSLVLHSFPEFEELIVNRIHAVLPDVLSKLGLPSFSSSRIETQLTAHNDSDYYKLHNDNASQNDASREITYVYYFHREPKPFTGGELRIYDSKIKDETYYADSFKIIEPRNNSIVFFPSRYMHEVLTVSCPSQAFADSRFTMNGWIWRTVASSL